ncbi:MAG: hypothetical protein HYT88_04755 [Candidatus Omnitrophica bacterium]|nr:hypothetical protein [Candidatus Omnitrophota bacterium]MBI2173823.1 hypothetical protein [Candidatus Omnitrophota bacterium]MBI3010236.1 hypothetical protein [Candidatus Omnitrophota bacterium]
MAWHKYEVKVGLPHTSYRGLSESRWLMTAGQIYWDALSEELGKPISRLRGAQNETVYATIVFIEESFPENRGLWAFGLDDTVRFLVSVRSGGPLACDGRVVWDSPEQLQEFENPDAWGQEKYSAHPWIRFGSFFASPTSLGSLQLTRPVAVEAGQMDKIPFEEQPTQHLRRAQQVKKLEIIPDDWKCLNPQALKAEYAMDPDRDTNAAGIVYFASYVFCLEAAERQALERQPQRWKQEAIHHRRLIKRRIAYLGSARPTDQLSTEVFRFTHPSENREGLRSCIRKQESQELLCVSEALVTPGPEPIFIHGERIRQKAER